MPVESSFTIGTWNVLATAYIRPAYYPRIRPQFLDPAWRVPELVRRARELGPDIFCLQEVEREVFAALEQGLPEYSGRLAMKAAHKPDGCATFLRASMCQLIREERLEYADGWKGGPPSGHVAQFLVLDVAGLRVVVVNTHLKWDAPETPRERRWDYRQGTEILGALDQVGPTDAQIICGDFNATPDSAVLELLTGAGFHYAHAGEGVSSCNFDGVPKLIDYICYRGNVRAEPAAVAPIDSRSLLPSAEMPSDHLPLVARIVGTASPRS